MNNSARNQYGDAAGASLVSGSNDGSITLHQRVNQILGATQRRQQKLNNNNNQHISQIANQINSDKRLQQQQQKNRYKIENLQFRQNDSPQVNSNKQYTPEVNQSEDLSRENAKNSSQHLSNRERRHHHHLVPANFDSSTNDKVFRQTMTSFDKKAAANLSPTCNPRAKLGMTLFGTGNNGLSVFSSTKISFAPKTLDREQPGSLDGSLKQKHWRPSYDTGEINDIITMYKDTKQRNTNKIRQAGQSLTLQQPFDQQMLLADVDN